MITVCQTQDIKEESGSKVSPEERGEPAGHSRLNSAPCMRFRNLMHRGESADPFKTACFKNYFIVKKGTPSTCKSGKMLTIRPENQPGR